MKVNKLLIAFASASFLVLTGCKKFGDTNINPDVTGTPSTGALLTNVQSGLGAFASLTRGGLYAQQFSETQYTETSLYSLPRLDFDGTYAASLYDLQNIINVNTDDATKASATKFGSNANQIALARILKAYTYWTITDRWGDVPYFEALKGTANLSPKYDKQEDIYKDLVKELKEAIEQFDGGAVPSGDIMYRPYATLYPDPIAQWKKVANSLRMLIALRTSKVYPDPGGWAATEFASAFADPAGYISSNTDNLVANYPGGAFKNPWFVLYDGRTDYGESDVVTDSLAGLSDPRLASFGSSSVGFPYGLLRDDAVDFADVNSNYARILAPSFRAANSPLVIISYSQVALAIAEAAQRGWIAAPPDTWYKNGIQASWDQWGVTGDINNYYSNSKVDLATGNALRKIQFQQYLAFYPDGTQAWANWKRTGVPTLVPPADASNSGRGIPRRYTYGQREYDLNKSNVETAAALYNNNSEVGRMWWDL